MALHGQTPSSLERYLVFSPVLTYFFVTVRLHVMQCTVLLSEFCLSVRPSVRPSVCLSVRQMRVL